MNPKAVGEISEAHVLAALIDRGDVVLFPFGNNQRYDFVIDHEGVFERIQVKTGRLRSGSVRFNTSSVNGFTGKRTTYESDADTFAVYCAEVDSVYLIPVNDCGRSVTALRVDLPKVHSSKTRYATDYKI